MRNKNNSNKVELEKVKEEAVVEEQLELQLDDVVVEEPVDEVVEEPVNEVVEEPVDEVVEEPVDEVVEEPVNEVVEVFTKGLVTGCSKLNVRKEADKNSEVFCTVNELEEVTISDKESTDEFYKICTSSGIEGFCMKQYIKLV